jgi:hypothetical protein
MFGSDDVRFDGSSYRLCSYIKKVERVVAGDLREWLPECGGDDPFNKLAVIVNGLLANIETLITGLPGGQSHRTRSADSAPACQGAPRARLDGEFHVSPTA